METKNTNLNNNQPKALILVTTGDFNLKSLGATLIAEEVEILDNEYEVWEIEITPGITFNATHYLLWDYLKWNRDNDYLGDDLYYDYLPDAIDQVLMLAVQESEEAFKYALSAIGNDEFLTRKNNPDDPSFTLGDYNYHMGAINAARKAL